IAIQQSSDIHFNTKFSIGQIKKHLIDKEYYAIYDKGIVGAAYFNGNDFHIGMIKKGSGHKAIKQICNNRHIRAVINNSNKKTIKLAKYLGFEFQRQDNKYTYMVKK
ncbi:MAG: hypothetical protein KJO69_03755, partial [Gammaproteobacteria bacterium]|nr:hypothetical protein [Gammaproteobacteria bacterium]